MKAYKHLVKHSLAKGCTVSVWDGEEWQLSKSSSYKAIVEAVESVEVAELSIRYQGEKMGWAMVSAYGLEDDETVIDYTETSFMKEWDSICFVD